MPGAGHIVHMPAHIFQRVGRYADASAANAAAAQADAAYIAQAKPPAWMYYSGMYFTHNYQFLAYSESMRGRSAGALQACREMTAHLSDDVLHMGTGLDWYAAQPWFVLERFGLWKEMLAEKAPDPKLQGLSAHTTMFARRPSPRRANRPRRSRRKASWMRSQRRRQPMRPPDSTRRAT